VAVRVAAAGSALAVYASAASSIVADRAAAMRAVAAATSSWAMACAAESLGALSSSGVATGRVLGANLASLAEATTAAGKAVVRSIAQKTSRISFPRVRRFRKTRTSAADVSSSGGWWSLWGWS
jgi:hypothetical protein